MNRKDKLVRNLIRTNTRERGLREKMERSLKEAERKAWDSLAKYKFWMFGYYAARVVTLRQLLGMGQGNPFRDLVQIAQHKFDGGPR